jgi:hypothetical protein
MYRIVLNYVILTYFINICVHNYYMHYCYYIVLLNMTGPKIHVKTAQEESSDP